MDSFDHVDLCGAILTGWDLTRESITLHLRAVLVYVEILPGQYRVTRHRAWLRMSGAPRVPGDLHPGEIVHASVNAPDGAPLPFTALVVGEPPIADLRLLLGSDSQFEVTATRATLVLEEHDDAIEEIVSALD